MKLTQPLYVVPRFRFWKDFGAGKKRKITFYRYWKLQWRMHFFREKVEDHTLKIDELPAGARIFEAEDFMLGHPDMMPDEIKKVKHEKTVYDHPWPFNVSVDPIANQTPHHFYNINTRFFVPRDDALTMTNTVLVNDRFEARPPIEPTEEHVEIAQRAFDWATQGDANMTRLPKKKVFPHINLHPRVTYGLSKERKEINVLNSMMDLTHTILTQHNHQSNNKLEVRELLERRNINYPQCNVPYDRDGKKMLLDLCIDSLSLSKDPLRLFDSKPEETRNVNPVDISPRTWRSILEKNRAYTPDWSFALPHNAFPHTIQLASRILRNYRDPNEMLARAMVHAFGLTSQFARIRQKLQNDKSSAAAPRQDDTRGTHSTLILNDPLEEDDRVVAVNNLDILPEPVVLQAIGLEIDSGLFHFLRYQLNTIKFDDNNDRRVKNQAWYSGPIPAQDLQEVLRYYLDFQLPKFESRMKEDPKTPEDQDAKPISATA